MSEERADLGAFIRQQRERSMFSLRKLAEKAEISNPYLSQIERGIRKPSADILKAIARGLSISAETLYVRAGLLEEPKNRPSVEEAIRDDLGLSEKQKEALIEIYRTFNGSGSAEEE